MNTPDTNTLTTHSPRHESAPHSTHQLHPLLISVLGTTLLTRPVCTLRTGSPLDQLWSQANNLHDGCMLLTLRIGSWCFALLRQMPIALRHFRSIPCSFRLATLRISSQGLRLLHELPKAVLH
ncbi:hypothetical protein DUNSADRAFT_15737 [Dunaliella salina]|uniref:Encoded protein n=1 Tax=Dunaliella salina TaxID=3046 RepID=A0ABQ7H9A8_DUNSA|nr:hypothetical protein DUNSADRAFT_15737 [Dunaliella salina]|eukprot:KAF5843442.1 hypothetical protein DUNSADRAFT_15737 [Dunaliella salina]